jgi:hypothetical protein
MGATQRAQAYSDILSSNGDISIETSLIAQTNIIVVYSNATSFSRRKSIGMVMADSILKTLDICMCVGSHSLLATELTQRQYHHALKLGQHNRIPVTLPPELACHSQAPGNRPTSSETLSQQLTCMTGESLDSFCAL